jgi:hypothetical protein
MHELFVNEVTLDEFKQQLSKNLTPLDKLVPEENEFPWPHR